MVGRVISHVVSARNRGALALAKSKISLASCSCGQELEADAVGVGISARAGYDAFGASRFLTSMSRYATLRASPAGQPGGGRDQIDFISSHPSTPERISIAVANASQYAAPGNGDRERKEFLDAAQG